VNCGISESGLRAAATKNKRARNKAAGRIAGGGGRKREVDVMTRGGGHVVLGVCSPFEEACRLYKNLCRLSKVSWAGKVCRARTR
jgi:hypothetical protein